MLCKFWFTKIWCCRSLQCYIMYFMKQNKKLIQKSTRDRLSSRNCGSAFSSNCFRVIKCKKLPFLSPLGTIHLRSQHVLGWRGIQRSQYIRIKNPLHKHFTAMPMVGGQGSKIVKICRRLKWMVPKQKSYILVVWSLVYYKHLPRNS